MRNMVRIAVAALMVLAACGDDDDTASDGEFSHEDIEEMIELNKNAPDCSDMPADGRPTDDVVADLDSSPCKIDGEATILARLFLHCEDGSELSYNQYGYGVEGGEWVAVDNFDTPSISDGNYVDSEGNVICPTD